MSKEIKRKSTAVIKDTGNISKDDIDFAKGMELGNLQIEMISNDFQGNKAQLYDVILKQLYANNTIKFNLSKVSYHNGMNYALTKELFKLNPERARRNAGLVPLSIYEHNYKIRR